MPDNGPYNSSYGYDAKPHALPFRLSLGAPASRDSHGNVTTWTRLPPPQSPTAYADAALAHHNRVRVLTRDRYFPHRGDWLPPGRRAARWLPLETAIRELIACANYDFRRARVGEAARRAVRAALADAVASWQLAAPDDEPPTLILLKEDGACPDSPEPDDGKPALPPVAAVVVCDHLGRRLYPMRSQADHGVGVPLLVQKGDLHAEIATWTRDGCIHLDKEPNRLIRALLYAHDDHYHELDLQDRVSSYNPYTWAKRGRDWQDVLLLAFAARRGVVSTSHHPTGATELIGGILMDGRSGAHARAFETITGHTVSPAFIDALRLAILRGDRHSMQPFDRSFHQRASWWGRGAGAVANAMYHHHLASKWWGKAGWAPNADTPWLEWVNHAQSRGPSSRTYLVLRQLTGRTDADLTACIDRDLHLDTHVRNDSHAFNHYVPPRRDAARPSSASRNDAPAAATPAAARHRLDKRSRRRSRNHKAARQTRPEETKALRQWGAQLVVTPPPPAATTTASQLTMEDCHSLAQLKAALTAGFRPLHAGPDAQAVATDGTGPEGPGGYCPTGRGGDAGPRLFAPPTAGHDAAVTPPNGDAPDNTERVAVRTTN